jgi:hypothetical protein
MSQALTRLPLLLLACGALCVATEVPRHAKSQKTAVKPSPAQAMQSQPAPVAQQVPQPIPPPVTPEHGPSSPPDVNFQGGQLTIVARNSTLGDVMNAVKQKTGAAVEMPPASGERVVGQFGPGSPRDVMAQLLNGSHYDYVLLGSPADPGALKKIVLMAKASGPEPASGAQQQMNEPLNQPLQTVPEVDSENPDENAGEPSTMTQQPEEEAQPQPEQPEQQQNAPVVKTPEQLLRELQQQQQIQQQQNQNGPSGAPGQPPQDR